MSTSSSEQAGSQSQDSAVYLEALDKLFYEAQHRYFPPFLGPISESTPTNATPYVCALKAFMETNWSPSRARLVSSFKSSLSDLQNVGARSELIIVGGSFLSKVERPRDIDCVIFYTDNAVGAIDHEQWQEQAKARGVDARLFPIEASPVMVLKVAMYFASLYTSKRNPDGQMTGTVLIDCSR